MATTLALAMRASMSAGGVVSGANDAAKAMDKMGRHAQQAARDMSVLKNIAIGAVIAKGVSMAADAFLRAGQAVLTYAQSVAQSVDVTNDLAQRLGMGVEALQALQMAAKLSGVDDVTGALQKLTVAIGTAAESGNTEAFEKLGIDFEELQAMSPEDQFRRIQSAIAALPTTTERAAAAVAIFGKTGVELLPLMSQNLEEVEERMRRLGAIVGDDQAEAIGSMNDSLDMVRATFDGIIGNVVGNLAPAFESLANDFLEFVEEWNNMSGGSGIADAISSGLLDIADYFAGVFDNTIASLQGFSVNMQDTGSVLEFVGNVFTAAAETMRAAFNVFQLAGDALAAILGTFLESLGSVLSQGLEDFGRTMKENAMANTQQNSRDLEDAAGNAAQAAGRAVFGGNAAEGADGPASAAVDKARERMNPEARAQREAEREAKRAEDKAAREAAAAQKKAEKEAAAAKEKADKEAAEAKKRQDEAAKKAAAVQEKIDDKSQDVAKIETDRAAALGGKSNEALKANDVRSSEGMSQFLALATGREDPAIAEYRRQTEKLNEIKAELRALQQEKVEILGAAA